MILEKRALSHHSYYMYIGKVAENANIDSAATPKWRTSKSHVSFLLLATHNPYKAHTPPKKLQVIAGAGLAGQLHASRSGRSQASHDRHHGPDPCEHDG